MNRKHPRVLSSDSLNHTEVVNASGEKLGEIEELMIELDSGRVGYAVLSFGGFLGMGDKLFAIPWNALRLDTEKERFVLDVSKETLKNAPGFDKNDWPDFADRSWGEGIYRHYGTKPYWS